MYWYICYLPFDPEGELIGGTKLASSRNGRHSPNAFNNVVMFFFGSGRASASMMGLCGLVKKRIICSITL